MSVYVGIDVHRKRSQVAVITKDGQVQLNKNVVNGSEPMLRLIGDLPTGTPVAFEAHLVHPLRCKAIASARLKNDKGPAPRSWRGCCARTCCPGAWIAPAEVRQLRALLRHRAGLTPVVRGSDLTVRHGHIPGRARPGCGGSSTRPPRPPSGPRNSPPPTPPSPNGAARRSPPSRSPASC
jgi:hypothetical protein